MLRKNTITLFLSICARCSILFLGLCMLQAFGTQKFVALESVVQEHISLLSNLNKTNPPLLILFSATAGMGKTTIATMLENKLSGIRITLDQVRLLMKKHTIYPITGTEQDKISYVMYYFDTLLFTLQKNSNNQLIILDDTVDRMYQEIVTVASHYQYPTFLIRIKVSKETAIRRIKSRESDPAEYLSNIDRFYKDYLLFNQKYVDYSIDNEIDGENSGITSLVNMLASDRLNQK